MGKSRKKGQRRVGQCAYCGATAELSDDHVIPLCLFTKPRPSNLITVLACDPCNNAKSKDDDYLRDMLVIDIDCSNSPAVQALLSGSVIRSARRGSSAIGRVIASRTQLRPLYTPAGIYLGTYPSIPLEGQRINYIFSRIVKGLYYSKFQQRLPNEYTFEIRRLHPLGVTDVREALQRVGCNGPYRWGQVFGCVFLFAEEDPAITYWLLWFFDRYFVTVSTEPPNKDGTSAFNP